MDGGRGCATPWLCLGLLRRLNAVQMVNVMLPIFYHHKKKAK